MRILIFALAMSLAAPAAASGKSIYRVPVDGLSYKVIVQDGQVKVWPRGLNTFGKGRTVEQRDRMRRAVKIATGCDFVDDEWVDVFRTGRLNCEPSAQSDPA